MNKGMIYRHRGLVLAGAVSLAFLGAALLDAPVAAQSQADATVTFAPATVVIEQGTLSVDFYGTISNPSGSTSFVPQFENFNDISGSQTISPLITYYDSFGSPDNLPASVDPGTTSSPIDFFTIDTSGLTPDVYIGSMSLLDQSGNSTAPAKFTLTVVPAPEPSAWLSLTLGAAALGVLTMRARRRQSVV